MLPLRCLLQDDRIYAVDKPAGLLVHPSALDAGETDTALRRAEAQAGQRLWPVHRLDRGTSGVLLFARDADAARHLGAAFEAGAVTKDYRALVRGWPSAVGAGGRIDHPLARDPERPSAGQPMREAATLWQCLAHFEWPFAVDARHPCSRYALVQVQPLTGRRHQIRRHFKHIAHPLIGDTTHGKGAHNRAVAAWLGQARLWLHAQRLAFDHPDRGGCTIECAPGPEWQSFTVTNTLASSSFAASSAAPTAAARPSC